MPGILIVDDNSTIRGLLRSFVETNTGFEVCGEAENGPDGIQKAKELEPDLVLLDMTMPGMLGTEAAPILKRLLPQVKIILFTLHTDGVNQALASTFDIDIVLSKTDIIAKLQEHLIALLAPVDSARIPMDVKDKRIN
jgi:DNA-binding NarL/FixJ family response regulator